MQFPNRALYFASALVLLISGWVYSQGVGGDFLLDDVATIQNNSKLAVQEFSLEDLTRAAFSTDTGPLKRPISMLAFSANVSTTGLQTAPMQYTNIAIHLLNGVLLFLIGILLSKSLTITGFNETRRLEIVIFFVISVWIVSPINLTSVLYIVQRMTSLSGTFVLLGLLFYLYGRVRMLTLGSNAFLIWTVPLICLVLAALTKETGVLLPVYILLVELVVFKFKTNNQLDTRILSWFLFIVVMPSLVGLIWVVHNFQVDFSRRDFNVFERLLTETRVLFDYVTWIVAPRLSELTLHHDDYVISRSFFSPVSTSFALLFHIILLAIAIFSRRKNPLCTLGIFWFYAGHVITATIFDLELVYEHRNYIPSLGLLLAFFVSIDYYARRIFIGQYIPLIFLFIFGVNSALTYLRSVTWSNTDVLTAVSAQENPQSLLSQYRLGANLLQRSPNDDNWTNAEIVLEHATSMSDSIILPESALIIGSSGFGKLVDQNWWNSMKRKVVSDHFPSANIVALTDLNRCAKSEKCHLDNKELHGIYEIAARSHPKNVYLLTAYGDYALNVLKDLSLARSLVVRCIELQPRNPTVVLNMIYLDLYVGDFDSAKHYLPMLHRINRFGQLNKDIRKVEQQIGVETNFN